MQENKITNTVKYSFLQATYWMGFNSISGFISVYLLFKGSSNSQIGVVIAIGGIISAILQPFIGDFADKSIKITLRHIIIAMSVFTIICTVFLLLNASGLIIDMIIYTILIALTQMMCPLVNAAGMYYINRGVNINFGIARGMGSLMYAVCSVVIGKLADVYNARVIPIAIIIIAILEIAASLLLKYKLTEQDEKAANSSDSTGNRLHIQSDAGIFFLKKYPHFAFALLGFICVYLGHGILNNFAFQIVTNLGGGSSQMGVLTAIAALAELPTMFVFASLIKKIPSGNLLKVSGVFFTIKALGTFLALNMSTLFVVQLAQMLGFGLYALASVYYANEVVEECDKVKGQTYVGMANMLGILLGSILGGKLMDIGGVPYMTLAASLFSIAGTIIIFISSKKTYASIG